MQSIFPNDESWPKKCGCHSTGFHGEVFTGGDSTLMLEQVGLLENMAQGELNLLFCDLLLLSEPWTRSEKLALQPN